MRASEFCAVAMSWWQIGAIRRRRLLATPGGSSGADTSVDARVNIDGLIRSIRTGRGDGAVEKKFIAAAVILHISFAAAPRPASEQLYDAFVRLKRKTAGGGGRWHRRVRATSPRSRRSYRRQQDSPLVGSIGVLFQIPNVTEL